MELYGPVVKGKKLNGIAMNKVFKICEKVEWESIRTDDFFEGSKMDQSDGFIHFSTLLQLKGTLKKHFASKAQLYLLEVNTDDLDIVWEVSRSNEFFPHLYQPLPLGAVARVYKIFMDSEGNHIIPEQVSSN